MTDLLLHVRDTVGDIPGHFGQEFLEGCDGAGRHASACETIVGGETNRRALNDIRFVRVMMSPCPAKLATFVKA